MTEIVQKIYLSESFSVEGGQLNQAWKKLKQAQKRQAKFELEFDQVVNIYCEEVLPKERFILLKPCAALIEHLIPFLSRKTITQAQRESLLHWLDTLIGNLSRLDNGAAEVFRSRIFHIMQEYLKDQKTLKGHKVKDDHPDALNLSEKYEQEQMSEEILSKFDARSDNLSSTDNITDADFSYESMTKSPWFTSLFRKTAQALHPDRELDDQKRHQKELLMVQLVTARQQGDILKVLELYTNFVCNDPKLSKIEVEQVVRLIKDQTRKVHHKKEDYILRQPERAFAYDRIYAKTAQRQKQNIKETIQDFYELRDSLIYCRQRIKSIASLSSFLF